MRSHVSFPRKKETAPATRDGFLIHQRPWLFSIARPFRYRLAIGIVCACEQRTLDNSKN